MEKKKTEELFFENYAHLTEDNKKKMQSFLQNVLKVQRAETRVTAKIHVYEMKCKKERENKTEGYFCTFCEKHQDECNVLIQAGEKNPVFICDECVGNCVKILEDTNY